ELAYLTVPTDVETQFISAEHERFQTLLDHLLDADFGSIYFLEWLRRRVCERRTSSGAQVGWTKFEKDEPALAVAALRLFNQYGRVLPGGVNLGERHRLPPTADDWVALIDDYCTGHLKHSADLRDQQAWAEIQAALPALGYVLTRRGIRKYIAPVDRVLA